MKIRILLFIFLFLLNVGCHPSGSTPLDYESLMNGFKADSPVDHSYMTIPEGAVLPEVPFEGRLELLGEESGGNVKILRGGEGLEAEAKHLPDFDFAFIQSGSELIPVQRGLIITPHPVWNIILEPGRVWQDPADQGYARASLPFTLVPKGGSSSFNGVVTFLFNSTGVSKVWYQVTQETSSSLRMDMWGLLEATYHPEAVEGADQIQQDYAQEVANRFPTRPIEQLSKDYPGVNLDAFSDHVSPGNMTTYGVVVNGINYRGGCPTRYGEYPYCEWIRMSSFSTAKTAFVFTAMLRLGEKYDPQISKLLVTDYVPEAAASRGDWSVVTLDDVLDMATGNYTSASNMVDEESRIFDEFFGSGDYADMIRVAFDWPHSALPGTQWVYRSSDTFIAVQALQNYLRTKEGPTADLFDFLAREVYQPLRIGPGFLTTLRTSENNWQGQPFGATGLWWIPDDIAKLATFLNVDRGEYNGEQLLLPDLLASALQAEPGDGGVNRPGGRYNDSLWADLFTAANGFSCTFYVPYMAGYSGNIIALLPNSVTYYYFSDNREFNWYAAVQAAGQIAPLCPESSSASLTLAPGI